MAAPLTAVKRLVVRVLLGAVLTILLFVAWLGFVWPPPLWWSTHWPAETAFMAMRERQLREAARPPARDYHPVPLAAMTPWLARSATIAEDDAFYQHGGIDWASLGHVVQYRRRSFRWSDAADRAELWRALGNAAEHRDRLRGASTITQQLAKNLYLSPSRNPLRKVKEALAAYQLEWSLPKERILELYLNIAELGPNLWGVDAAARRYFRRGADRVSMEQSALLIATLPHPLTSNPSHRPGRTRWRAQLILRRLRGEDVEVPKETAEDTVPAVVPLELPMPLPFDTVKGDSLPWDSLPRDSQPAVPPDTLPPRPQ